MADFQRQCEMRLLRARQKATDELLERFGRPAEWVVAAPGRVNLVGGHVDYNDGIVLPFAIERYTVIAGARNHSRAQCRLFSFALNDSASSRRNLFSHIPDKSVAIFSNKEE